MAPDFYEFLPPRWSCEGLPIKCIKSYSGSPVAHLVNHHHNFSTFLIIRKREVQDAKFLSFPFPFRTCTQANVLTKPQVVQA